MTRENRAIVAAGIMVIMSFIAIYAGHFLFSREESDIHKEPETITPVNPIVFKRINTVINGNEQCVNILEIDLKASDVIVKPVLSFDVLYGFETLSAMVSRHKAYAGVNGGFFYEYGLPSGMVGIDGEIVTGSSGRFPVFILTGRNALLTELKTNFYVKVSGEKVKIDGINSPGTAGSIIAYNSWYGNSNRASMGNITAVIENGIITRLVESEGETKIPDGGMLITFYKPLDEDAILPFEEGGKAELLYDPYIGEDFQAYECGSWVVKNGVNAAPERDPWVGILTNRDPRTIIGLKNSTSVVLMTVDGRQPGYSAGFTAKELAEFLINYGVRDAAMLDGGASTEMIVNDEIVNKPSFKGQERPLGGAIIVKN